MKVQISKVSLALTGLLSLVGIQDSFARPADGDIVRERTTVSDRGDRGVKPTLTTVQVDEADRNDFTKIKLSSICSDQRPELGVRKCEIVKKDAKKYLRAAMGHVIHHYYEGKLLQFDDQKGFCIQETLPAASIPICSYMDKGTPEDVKNRKNESCAGPLATNANKGYCAYPIAQDFSTCGYETSWLRRGSRVQTWEHHIEEVEKDIDSGTVTLVDYSADSAKPARMCEGYAKAIKALLYGTARPGAVFADAFVRENFPALALNTTVSQACAGQSSDSLVDRAPSAVAPNTATTDDAANVAGKQGISGAACHLTLARANIEALFFKLSACEAYYRGTKTYFEAFEHSPDPWTAVSENVVTPCLAYARGKTGSSTDKTSDATFMNHFYSCYRGEVASHKGIKDMVKDIMQAAAPTEEAAPYKNLGGEMKECVIAAASATGQ